MQRLLIVAAVMVAGAASGYDSSAAVQVTPRAEREHAQAEQMRGPSANRGVAGVEALGAVSLADEIADPDGHVLRARRITVEPGGVIAVHQHRGRPGLAYILEGEIAEHRGQPPRAITHGVGSVAFEQTGVVHWWENRSGAPVRALVVDLVPAE